MSTSPVHVGTAGWMIPRAYTRRFPGAGSHLERYSRIFTAVEINSSFHQPHKRSTYDRWAASAPPGFRFAVKAPREITHVARLENVHDALAQFLEEAGGLGNKLGPILFQLPPSLEFDARLAGCFFELLRDLHGGHQSWSRGTIVGFKKHQRIC